MQSLSAHCTQISSSLPTGCMFLVSSYTVLNSSDVTNFLSSELAKTRFHFDSLPITFQTYAGINRVEHANIQKSWHVVEKHIFDFRTKDPDYESIEEELDKLSINTPQIESIIASVKHVITRSRKSLYANLDPIKVHIDKKIGTVGELLCFLYSRDFQAADCSYHKLVPDNVHVPRHGMDLLTVKFGPIEDMVHFWEAKGTVEHFNRSCHEIVDWFTNTTSFENISLVIEAARIDWAEKLSPEKFRRASQALSRFQANMKNFRYVGCILHDSQFPPTPHNIQTFDKIKVDKDNKHLIIIGTESLKDVVEEVYKSTCKM